MESRLIPACLSARSFAASIVPGLASVVISQSSVTRKDARISPSSRANTSGASRVGVPPPKKMLSTRCSRRSKDVAPGSANRFSSASSCSAYASRSRLPAAAPNPSRPCE